MDFVHQLMLWATSSPQSKKLEGSIPTWSLTLWNNFVLLSCSSLLTPFQFIYLFIFCIITTISSKINVIVHCIKLFFFCSAISNRRSVQPEWLFVPIKWWLVQGVRSLQCRDSWDRLQQPPNSSAGLAVVANGQMDGWMESGY